MYLTILTQPKDRTTIIDFNKILANPYMTLASTPNLKTKKVTIEITEEYGTKLCTKMFNKLSFQPPYEIKDALANHYTSAYIAKRSNPNKKRRIDMPDPELKGLQSYYKTFIENTLLVQLHDAAHAYTRGRDTLTANQRHQMNESKWSLKIDLKDFFPSINEVFMRKMLLQVFPFKFLDPVTLNNIIKYSLLNDTLPQGSPLSPTISNVVMIPIDHAIKQSLHNLDKKYYVYTRYADDIQISCKYKFNPEEIIQLLKDIFKQFDAPIKINPEKIKFGNTSGRNYYLGYCLNNRNEISNGHEANKRFRAMLYNFAKAPKETTIADAYQIMGKISYFKRSEPDFVTKQLYRYNKKFGIDIMKELKKLIAM